MSSSRPSVLFFGRAGDSKSEKCIEHLNNLDFEVSVVWSSKRDEKLPKKIKELKVDYILCYRSYFILPKKVLNSPKFYSINFHPGSPEYPGTGGINFALYNEDKFFGVTAHLMEEKVDSGKILSAKYFPIHEKDNLFSLLDRTHNNLFELFKEFTTNLRNSGKHFIQKELNNIKIEWSGKKRTSKDIDNYQLIKNDIDEIELERRIRSFNYTNYPIELKLHGRSFILKENE